MRSSQPLVRSDGDLVFVSWNGGRSWLVLDDEGNLTERFRAPAHVTRVFGGRCCDHNCQAG